MPKAVAEKDLIRGCGGKETSSLYRGGELESMQQILLEILNIDAASSGLASGGLTSVLKWITHCLI